MAKFSRYFSSHIETPRFNERGLGLDGVGEGLGMSFSSCQCGRYSDVTNFIIRLLFSSRSIRAMSVPLKPKLI